MRKLFFVVCGECSKKRPEFLMFFDFGIIDICTFTEEILNGKLHFCAVQALTKKLKLVSSNKATSKYPLTKTCSCSLKISSYSLKEKKLPS